MCFILSLVVVMHSAEDLYADVDVENDLEVIHDNDEGEINSGNEDQENDVRNENNEEENKAVKPKRVVRNPQPKLNVETLKGPKGLVCLEGYFKNKKYKGRGYEEEDLRVIMKTYEYWCHRLFPKYPFDDCLTKIEKLGTKKPMQAFIKRIRMDLILDEERPIQSDDEREQPAEEFDTQFDSITSQDNQVEPTQQVTAEQLERIRKNKEKADQLRQERLQLAKQRAQALTVESSFLEKSDVIIENGEHVKTTREKAECLRQEKLQQLSNSCSTSAEAGVSTEHNIAADTEIQSNENISTNIDESVSLDDEIDINDFLKEVNEKDTQVDVIEDERVNIQHNFENAPNIECANASFNENILNTENHSHNPAEEVTELPVKQNDINDKTEQCESFSRNDMNKWSANETQNSITTMDCD